MNAEGSLILSDGLELCQLYRDWLHPRGITILRLNFPFSISPGSQQPPLDALGCMAPVNIVTEICELKDYYPAVCICNECSLGHLGCAYVYESI